MLGALFGAIASLPVVAAGEAAKGVGDAVKRGAGGIPVLAAAGDSLETIGGMVSGGGRNISQAIGNVDFGQAFEGILGAGRTLGGFMAPATVAMGAPEVSTLGRNVQQANLTTQFCVAEANLGGLAAPTVGCKPAVLDGPALFT